MIRMEDHLRPTRPHSRSSRTEQCSIVRIPPIATTRQQRRTRLGVRPRHTPSSGVARIIAGTIETITAEEQKISAPHVNKVGSLNQWPISVTPLENRHWIAIGGDAVHLQFLQHDGRGVRSIPIAASAPTAERVAIDFIDDVQRAVTILEASRVDSAALLERAGEGGVRGGVVGPCDGG